jgi:segregation and condensation protein A
MMRSLSLPQFEGPIDLLLSLVRQNQFDILNLPMAEVTRQFLEYLAAAEKLDLDLDSEWFYVAALLINIKSRSLLPSDPISAEPQPDPQNELVQQLLDREQLLQAAGFLQTQWAALGGWPAPPPPETSAMPGREELSDTRGSLTLLEILALAQKAMVSVAAAENLEIPSDSVSVEEILAVLEQRLKNLPPGGRLEFADLWTAVATDQHRSALFLALLEGARAGRLDLEQDACFAPLRIRPVAAEVPASL